MTDQPIWKDEEIQTACQNPLHRQAVEGIRLFNHFEFFEAHEALEAAWRAEPGPSRDLYRGILLAAVTFLHMQRGNYEGALKVSRRCLKWLAIFGEVCCGVQVGALRRQVSAINQRLEQDGAPFLTIFTASNVTPIQVEPDWPIDWSDSSRINSVIP
jgi:hypothetical protein